MSARFTGAMLPVCDVEVLIVVVRPFVINDPHEAALYVFAFHERFGRTIVLMAQDRDRVPTYYGPAGIVRVLCTLPFEVIPWRYLAYRVPRPRAWKLPIPAEPPPPFTLDSRGGFTRELEGG
jgi:hypothetical protein